MVYLFNWNTLTIHTLCLTTSIFILNAVGLQTLYIIHVPVTPRNILCHEGNESCSICKSIGGTKVLLSPHIQLWTCSGYTVNWLWQLTAQQSMSLTLEQWAHWGGWWPPETRRVNTEWLLGACKERQQQMECVRIRCNCLFHTLTYIPHATTIQTLMQWCVFIII